MTVKISDLLRDYGLLPNHCNFSKNKIRQLVSISVQLQNANRLRSRPKQISPQQLCVNKQSFQLNCRTVTEVKFISCLCILDSLVAELEHFSIRYTQLFTNMGTSRWSM